MQPAYLSSAAHLEPAFMYKGEVCTGKFVFIPAKGYVKVRRVSMQLITAGRINRGIVKPPCNEIPSPSEIISCGL